MGGDGVTWLGVLSLDDLHDVLFFLEAPMPERLPAVYIVSNKRQGTLYIGVTSNLVQRVWQHKTHAAKGFTDRYNLNKLMYYELHQTMADAIAREKQLKSGSRLKKVQLIESQNPAWQDLYADLL